MDTSLLYEEPKPKEFAIKTQEILPSKTTQEIGYWMDGYLKKNLDVIRTAMYKKLDWDYHYITCGRERVGKTVFSGQICKYIDPNFDLDRIVFSANEFMKVSKKLEPHQAIQWDEAIEGGSGADAVTKLGRILKKFIAQMGQKNLFVMLCIPNFFDLNKNLAIHRTLGLFRVYAPDLFNKGYWGYYDIERKKNLWLRGKKMEDYNKQRYNVHGRFTEKYVFNKKRYLTKKAKALEELSKEKKERKLQEEKMLTIFRMKEKGYSFRKIGDFYDLNEATIRYWYGIALKYIQKHPDVLDSLGK